MAGGRRSEIEILLEKLHSCGLQEDRIDPRTAVNVVVDISEDLAKDLTPVQFDLYLKHLFGEKGIIAFGRKVVEDKGLPDARKATLDVLGTLLEKDRAKIIKYAEDIRKYCMFLYNVDKSAKVCATALEIFCKLLEKCSSHIDLEDINVDQFIERLCIDIRSAKASTVLQQQLRTLGMLLYCYPESLSHHAGLILKVFKDQLNKHMGSKPDLLALAGVIRGLTLYLHHFPRPDEEPARLFDDLYGHLKKVLNPNLNLPRRDAQRACLELLNVHGDKFSDQLFEDYDTIFTWLLRWCSQSNRDDRKAALPAMGTYMVVIAFKIEYEAEGDKKGVKVFKFLLQEYNRLLENSTATSHVSLAVKGYGLLSGACRRYLSAVEVNTMFNQVLAASQYTFYESSEMLENKLSNLPSYIESLAIIIDKMVVVHDVMLDSVLQLTLALVENFPMLAKPLRHLAWRAIYSLFNTVYKKAGFLHDFLHSFVYRCILVTCSHEPDVDTSMDQDVGESGGVEKWKGLKNEIVTYKTFLPVWTSLLSPEKVAYIQVRCIAAAVKTEICNILYSEFILCTLEITEKLNLDTYKNDEVKQEDGGTDEETATSDPVSGLKAKNPKDFQVYMNLVAIVGEVLPLQSENNLEQHVPQLIHYFVRQSLLQPLVSAHYSVITTVLTCSRSTPLFKNKEDPRTETVLHSIRSYIVELLQRCRQYRDQLLVSCLTLILQLPNSIVLDIFPELILPIQMALRLGVSYLPLAEVCVKALQQWSRLLPKDVLHEYFPALMPLLLPYLRSQESGGQAEVYARVISVKMTFARQRRKVDQKKMLESKRIDASAMRRVQMAILRLVGSLDPGLSLCVIPQDPESLAATAVRWDTIKHIKFATPFEQTKIDINLDDLLPHVVDLAVNCSDRQTKVAASELLHSIVIFMIGTGAQQSPETQEKYPMAPLYRRVFRAMLQLSCDPDQVTRQLFITLIYQTIHWFSNNRNFENPDTVVLLETIMEGIVSPNDPALRDISAQCLSEFVKWSRKQCHKKDKVSSNVKSILKRILSFCKHPSAFKRLGGSLAWNSMYREFREDAISVDIWTVELLVGLLTSLELAQSDDPALGTHEQTLAAIEHVERILREKKEVFWKKSSHRRVPLGLEEGTMEDLLLWLMNQLGKPKTLTRHKCMELLVSLAPLTQGVPSVQVFVQKYIERCSFNRVLDIVEGGGEAALGIRLYPNPCAHNQVPSLKDVTIFLEALLAALDGHSWLLGRSIVPIKDLCSCEEIKAFSAVNYFVEHMSCSTVGEYLGKKGDKEKLLITPLESQMAVKLKCTVVVRVMDFAALVMQDVAEIQPDILNMLFTPNFFNMVTVCVMDPMKIGFDLKDLEVKANLPGRLEDTLNVLYKKAPEKVVNLFVNLLEKQIQSPEHDISKNLPSSVSDSAPISLLSKQTLDGLQLLHKTGWLSRCSMVVKDLATNLSNWVGRVLLSESSAIYPHPSHQQFLQSLISLTFTLYPEVHHQYLTLATSSEMVSGHGGEKIRKGTHIMNVLGPTLIPHFVSRFDITMERCVELIQGENFQDGMSFASAVLSFLLRNTSLRKECGVALVQAFLNQWPIFVTGAGKLSSHHECLLGLLHLMFLVDGNNTIKASLTESRSTEVLIFYKGLLSQGFELQFKIKALKLLPFFLTMSEAISASICESLSMLSVNHFPLQSTEFTSGGAKDREYHQAINEILTALELSNSLLLLEFVKTLFVREEKHRYEEALQPSLEKFIKGQKKNIVKQVETLKFVYDMFMDTQCLPLHRQNIMDQILMPLLQQAGVVALERFLVSVIKDVMTGVSSTLSGRTDEQQKTLIAKIGSYSILQVMYSKLPREKLFAPGSEIGAAFRPSDESGKELTKEVFRSATKIAKGDLRHVPAHAELRRLCACAAYNTIIAVLVCVQNDLRFYTNLLFSANAAKGEAIWESLIDCNLKHEFDVEVNFKPGSKKRFVALRQSLKEAAKADGTGREAGTVQYMASHYLSDSSLRDDLGQFDFNNSVVLAMSQRGEACERMMDISDIDGELMTLSLDQSDYNGHETMANLTAVIHHMVDAKIMVLPPEGARTTAADVPQWMVNIQQKLENSETPRNVKLFLLRLMMNTSRVFASYAAHFVTPVLSCIADGTIGDKINYFLSDLLVMLMNWGKDGIPQDSMLGRNYANRVLLHLCKSMPHNRADIFKYNLDVIRSVVESWKNILTVPYTVLYALMETCDGQEREIEGGLQLLGIVLANGIAPYTVGNDSERTRCKSLLGKLMCGKGASIYGAAAELLGLYLKFIKSQNEETTDTEVILVKKITEMIYDKQSQALTCVYNIHKHYPSIINGLINRLLNMLPKLYGIHRTRILECLVSYSSTLEDVFTHLKEQNLTETLARKESSTQLVALQLVNAVMPRLSAPQLLYFMPGIVAFISHPAPKCREQMYDVLFWIYDKYSGSIEEEEGRQLESEARSVLLEAINEQDAILKQNILNFWLEGSRSLPLPQRLLHILRKLYSPGSEESFLPVATYILLEATSRSADYHRNIFDQPLTECKFREMKVSTAWQARHASMVPLFAETQGTGDSSFASYISLTQGSDVGGDVVDVARVQATQQKAFAETQQAGTSFNWVTESTFDTTMADIEYQATHNPTQGPVTGLMFTVGTTEKKDMRRYKSPGIGNSHMQPPGDGDVVDQASVTQSKLIRRRFVRNQDREKQSIYFAKLEYRRRRLRESLDKERKSRREAQVTMYRQYRVGELPDIQIQYKAMIAPLQALAQRDSKVAGMLFELLAQGIIDGIEFIMDRRDAEDWRQEVYSALNNVMASSYASCPQLLKTVLHLMINNEIAVDPEALSAACLDSHLEPLGILVLERQALLSRKEEIELKLPSRKKMKTDSSSSSSSSSSSDANLWLNMAELYKNLDMWDVVCGVVQEKLGNVKDETRLALEAEASNNPTQAFLQYRRALKGNEDWMDEPSPTETRIWKEWYADCAGMLGQWNELENFVEDRFLKDDNGHVNLDQVWLVPRPTSVVLPAVIHSKLMKILDGSDSDGNLLDFVNKAMETPHHRMLIEGIFPLQLAVLACHQENEAQAQSYLNATMIATLQALSQYSILTPKPLRSTLRNAQLLTELADFLKVSKYRTSGFNPRSAEQAMLMWKNQEADPNDNPLLLQCMAAYRDLYLHCLENQSSENMDQMIRDVKTSTHGSVVRAALQNSNYHLADRHLRKLKVVSVDERSLAQFYFLMTENHLLRAKSNAEKRLQFLVEAWAKYMGKVSSMSVLNEAADVEAYYLKLESTICYSLSEAIKEMGDDWDQDNKFLKVLADKFPGAQSRKSWYKELLQCSFNCLMHGVSLSEDKLSTVVQGTSDKTKEIYMKLARYCEDCLENWRENIDATEYSKHLIIAVLKAMTLGDREAHFQFPRLISLLEENPDFNEVFKAYSGKVPEWMFLLWLSHILIYIDKAPGPALQPIVEKLATEYPQALVYAFRISMQQYDFTSAVGKTAKVMCERVEAILQENCLFQQFTSALSLVVAPYIVCKDSMAKLGSVKDKTEIEDELKNIEENLLKINIRSTRGTANEKGESYIRQDRMRKKLADSFIKAFGPNFKKIQAMSLQEIQKQLKDMKDIFRAQPNDMRSLSRQLKSYSPWLASFHSSRYSDTLELPGQYSGLSKPLPEYHVKISNFDEDVLLMPSLRVPIRIVIRGDDEKEYKYLVKWGEDLRTDQRMEQMFVLMNKIYASSPLCTNTTSRPHLDTYQVVPLSLQVGLLQWVDSTRPLKDFINDSYKDSEKGCSMSARTLYGKPENWDPAKRVRTKDVLKIYEEAVNKIPWDVLRRGIVKLACSNEGFFFLRSAFAVSYATLCISHWLLGIGDRHCSNSLVSLKTGRVIGIDFGHHFESSAQVLPVPELMPFRLTPQIANVFEPVGASGALKEIMVAALGALRNSRHVLMAVLEAFVKEPTEDWINFVRMCQGNTKDEQVELFSQERIKILKAKLSGVNPTYVTKWAVSQNRALKGDRSVLGGLLEVIIGNNKESLRADIDKKGLSPHDQVDILMDLACDPNILGRTFIGWEPFL